MVCAAACSDDDGSASEDEPPTTSEPASSTSTTTITSTTTTTTSTTTTTTTTTLPDPQILGADLIAVRTPTSGGGPRPLLEWEPVDGAGGYLVVVYDADGRPYWSTFTTEPQTPMGGPVPLGEGRSGPAVAEGFTWVVHANGPFVAIAASSERRAIEP